MGRADALPDFLARPVDFLVAEDYALAAHGVVRATRHLDLPVRSRKEDMRAAVLALSTAGPVELLSGGGYRARRSLDDPRPILIVDLHEEGVRRVVDGTMAVMDAPSKPGITVRVFGPGESIPPDDDWRRMSPGERMSLVWELTKNCWAMSGKDPSALRLQRTVVAVHRPKR